MLYFLLLKYKCRKHQRLKELELKVRSFTIKEKGLYQVNQSFQLKKHSLYKKYMPKYQT